MAALSKRKNGTRFIQFTDENGRRPVINLGKISKRQAEAIHTRVERLLAARSAELPLDSETSAWVGSLSGQMRERLAKAGLIEQRESYTLKAFIDDYLKRRTDIKPRTRYKLQECGDRLCEFFGAERRLDSITKSEAVDHHRWLLESGLAPNTAKRLSGRAKQIFADALERELISKNPFKSKSVPTNVTPNKERLFYVTREMIAKVLDACPTTEWKVIIGLARFGGLRCPSEVVPLKWEDIDWERGRLTVTSPKTEHHPNGASRQCPLFPELRELLSEWQAECGQNTGPVVTRYRKADQNLGTTFKRFIRLAGLEPWPKPFQNCRSTRETELVEVGHPTHAVCQWLGNSEIIAQKFYLQVTDEHFARAAEGPIGPLEAQQKALQNVHEQACTAVKSAALPSQKAAISAGTARKRYPQQGSNLQPAV